MIEFELPMRLESTANKREHWAAKQNRERPQKRAALQATQAYTHGLYPLLVVTITRVGPRRMDSDNAIISAKHVRDSVAEALGVDDGHPAIKWQYEQAIGVYAVKVKIEKVA